MIECSNVRESLLIKIVYKLIFVKMATVRNLRCLMYFGWMELSGETVHINGPVNWVNSYLVSASWMVSVVTCEDESMAVSVRKFYKKSLNINQRTYPYTALYWHYQFIFNFSRVRKIAESDYQHSHVCLAVRSSGWNNSPSTGWIFVKCYIPVFLENLSKKLKFH